jgi:hypothetical protein
MPDRCGFIAASSAPTASARSTIETDSLIFVTLCITHQ